MSTHRTDLDVACDAERLNAVLQGELSEYLSSLREYTMLYDQVLRGACVAWLCVFAPEVISEDSKSRVLSGLSQVYGRVTHDHILWFHQLPLEIAAYGLTGDPLTLRCHVVNLRNGNEEVRDYVVESLALVADRLNCQDEEMLTAVEQNLELGWPGCEDLATMALMGRGSKEMKIDRLKTWLGVYRLNPQERTLLENLANGRYVPNRRFLPVFFSQLSYLFDHLCKTFVPKPDRDQHTLFEMRPPVRMFQRIRNHPLMRGSIEVASS